MKYLFAFVFALALMPTLTPASAATRCHWACRDGAWGTGSCEWVCN